MSGALPDELDPRPWLAAPPPTAARIAAALRADAPGIEELRVLISEQARPWIEPMAQRAQALTERHFGRTIALYAPLYLSNYCSSGCAYCGFASDRRQPRRRLAPEEIAMEMDALKAMGIEEILLLTGERTPQADFDYLLGAVRQAAQRFHLVTVEAFPMNVEEYRALTAAGCVGVTLYQETYEPEQYTRLHRWGPKQDFAARLDGPARALAAGLRTAGLGALLGLSDPRFDALALYLHLAHLRRRFWRAGFSISFPRVCEQAGGFAAPHPVDDARLAQIVFAFRIALPDVPLVLSTREAPAFRDGMAGVGISKMSVASRTTVGGYVAAAPPGSPGQFEVHDGRDVAAFTAMLRARRLEPVFKSWDAVYREAPAA